MRSHRLPAIICVALLPLTSLATPMTYQFSGQTQFGGYDGETTPESFPIVPWGTEFTGSFTYESETPGTYITPEFLNYRGAMTGATISFGPGGSLG